MKRLLMMLAAACFSAGAIADEKIGDPGILVSHGLWSFMGERAR